MIDKDRLKQEQDKHKFEYGRSFQIKLLLTLLIDKSFFLMIKESLSPSYFEDEGLSWLVQSIDSYYNEYKQVPTIDTLKMLATKIDNDILKILVNRIITEMENIEGELYSDIKFVKKQAKEFCMMRDMTKQIVEIDDGIHQQLSMDEVVERVQGLRRIVAKATEDSSREVSTYRRSFNERYGPNAVIRDVIPTGFPLIDSIMKGGLGKGEFGIILAPTGVGKSWGLINMAVHAAKLGYNVAYISLELYNKYIERRLDAVLSGIPLDDLEDNQDVVEEAVESLAGEIYVEWAPMKSISIDGIESRLERYEMDGIDIDIVFIDYIDKLKLSGGSKEMRHNLESTYDDARSLAGRKGYPIWSASQANREGSQSDVVQGHNMAEAFSKLNPLDFCMSFQRSPDGKKKGIGNAFVIKNRFGREADTFMMKTDLSRGYMELFTEDSEQGMSMKLQNNEQITKSSPEQSQRINSIVERLRANKGQS